MIQKIRNKSLTAFKNKKGFTLVEVIVVLVILAILAAILVPKLTGWIDESKLKTATGEGHLVLSALQADASEKYSKGIAVTYVMTDVQKYVEGDITLTATNLTGAAYSASKVTTFTYIASNSVAIDYTLNATTGKGSFTEHTT